MLLTGTADRLYYLSFEKGGLFLVRGRNKEYQLPCWNSPSRRSNSSWYSVISMVIVFLKQVFYAEVHQNSCGHLWVHPHKLFR